MSETTEKQADIADAPPGPQPVPEPARKPQAEKGVSLGRDAWRRLRRSRLAMVCLLGLIVLSVLALFTPLLPLQPPRAVHTELKYAPPTASPLFVPALELTPARLAAVPEQLAAVEAKLRQARAALAKATGTAAKRAAAELAQAERRVGDVIQAPYREAKFGRLNAFDRMLVDLRVRLFGPWCFNSLCGRDELGRDLLARLFWGARISLLVGLVATLVSLVIGVTYGAVSGYVGGWVDDLMMRVVDVLYSIPFIFVVIYLITILGQEEIKTTLESYGIDRITIFFFVVGAIYWLTMARVVRGQVISLKNELYVEAARSIGASGARIIFRHIVPNMFSVILVYLTLTIPRVMLFEAFLSFLGLGVEPPDVSWGLLANEGIKVITPVRIYWWLIVFPGLMLAATLFALNFFSDRLRDALDPRMKDR
jgi:oligopeptide transport system permease protein